MSKNQERELKAFISRLRKESYAKGREETIEEVVKVVEGNYRGLLKDVQTATGHAMKYITTSDVDDSYNEALDDLLSSLRQLKGNEIR